MTAKWLRSSIWNLVGIGAPFAVAIVCMPILVHRLGVERYGLLILAWTIVGYFSIFDFGMSRAITQLVAKATKDSTAEGTSVVLTGIFILGGLGVFGGLVFFLGAPSITRFSHIPLELQNETINSMKILGLGLPFVIISTGLRGALEGVFDFTGMNLIRLLSGIGTYLLPVAVMTYSIRLDWICASLVVLRGVSCLGYYFRCKAFFDFKATNRWIDFQIGRRLLNYGGWITVSNLISPFMAYLDRFLIAGVISLAMVGYYSSSQEVVTKFQIIPAAILSVLFPAISRIYESSPTQAESIFQKGAHYVTYALFPLAACSILFAQEGLGLWFGKDFAAKSYEVARILTIGSFVNCLALNPFSFLQGIGRPDVTAKVHLVELPIYLLLLYFLLARWGLIGVALAWTLRMAIDLSILIFALSRQWPSMRRVAKKVAFGFLGPIGALAVLPIIQSLQGKVLGAIVIIGFSVYMLIKEWRIGGLYLAENK